MQYQYAIEKQNYEDFAAGRVIISRGGMTSFPVRLASEIFQRCASYFPSNKRLRVYDPCCGGGYLATVLGFLHHQHIKSLYCSDIDSAILSLASANLGLLTLEGLNSRAKTLQQLADTYHKPSHHDALDSLNRLKHRLPELELSSSAWVADALEQTLLPQSVDLIMCDVPYGDMTQWQSQHGDSLISHLLKAQYPVLADDGVIAIISDKKQRTSYTNYVRLQENTIGKRRILILQKVA